MINLKTVVIDLTSLADNFSGIERFALSITSQLIKNDNIKFILVFKNKIHDLFDKNMTNVQKIVIKGNNKLIFNQFVLPLKLARIKADIFLFLAFPAPFLFFRKNAVSAIHDMGCWDCPQTNKWWMNIYFRILYRKAASFNKKIITVSEFSKNRIQDILHVKCQNIHVIYNGISDVFLRFEHDERQQALVTKKYNLPDDYILCLSTIEPRKNIKLLVDTYGTILQEERRVPYDLVLAGRNGWKNKDLYEQCQEFKNRIHFTGFIDDQDLPYVYCGARCFVFPSIYEGFGIPPIEALVCGVNVLSSNAASLPEILQDKAVYFENNDRHDLKNKLLELLEKTQQEKNYATDIKHKYNWKEQANRLTRELLQ